MGIHWTEALDAEMLRLVGLGKSASDIANELEINATRNAVLGRIFRLKNKGLKIERRVRANIGLSEQERALRVRKRRVLKAKAVAAQEALSEVYVPVDPISWSGLSSQTCRFPIGEPNIETMRFCGARPVPGQPYCSRCCGIVYVSPEWRNGHAPAGL